MVYSISSSQPSRRCSRVNTIFFGIRGPHLPWYWHWLLRRSISLWHCQRQDHEAHVRKRRDESRVSPSPYDTWMYVSFSSPDTVLRLGQNFRLIPSIAILVPIGLFLYGWTAEKHVHWIVPIIGTAFVGVGLLATFMPVTTYLVDAFTIYAASAIAASTILRSLMGALLPLAGRKMYQTLGLGWGNSLLAFIALAMCPMSWIFFRYGERIRKSPRFQIKF